MMKDVAPMTRLRLPWSRHAACVPDSTAYCVHPGCVRSATHSRPLGVSGAGDLIEELICCKHDHSPRFQTS